jgi:Spy/CpxP family protein refolding chaperone
MLKRFKWVALAATVALMAGCGAIMHQAAAGDPTEVLGFRTLEAGDAAPFHGPFARKLGLTAAQQDQIKAILEKHRPPQAQREQKLAELKALLLAPSVDQEAVKAWAAARKADFQAHQADRLAAAGELRAVLTDDQRTQLQALLAEDPPPFQQHLEGLKARLRQHMVGDLGLTAAQQTALDALHAKLEALHDPARRKAVHQAIAAFVQSGDQAALGAAMKAQFDGRLPVDDMIAFAASLDQAQRARLVGRLEGLARFHHPG